VKHPPPWWLRLPIYLDWIQSSFVVIVLATLLAHGRGGHRAAQSLVIIAAASLLIVLDLLVGLGYWWTLLPRAGLALAALVLCGRTIHWDPIRPEEWILVAIGGALGALVGWGQLVLLFGERLMATGANLT